jgi:hypothetical protein
MTAHAAVAGRTVIAVLNTSIDMIEVLSDLLADAGYTPVSAMVRDFRLGQRDIRAFFAEHQPRVVLYDVAIPYEDNWYFFQQHVLSLELLPPCCFVLTTTNRTVLDILVGPTPAFEVIGRPADLGVILEMVQQALEHSTLR